MNFKQARQLVRDNMEVVFSAQRKPDTFAMVQATVFGTTYRAPGWARYNPSDAGQGLPFRAKFGMRMATGRAVRRIAKRVARLEVLQIDVTITGIPTEQLESGHSHVAAIPEFAKSEEM